MRGNVLRITVSCLVGAAAVALGGCGGSTLSTSTKVIRTTTTPPAPPNRPVISSGPVRATIRGQSHTARAGVPWRYRLRVTGANGRPLPGMVVVRFDYAGRLVGHDVPPTHSLRDGELQESLTFAASAAGYPMALEATVHTPAGTVTLFWPLTVNR